MTYQELERIRRKWYDENLPYKMTFWSEFDYAALDRILVRRRTSHTDEKTYSDCLIMADTETSKKAAVFRTVSTKEKNYPIHENHVVAWTISIRAFGRNLVTLWGRKPSEMIDAIERIHGYLPGDFTIIYFHNLAYDYVFLRKFFFRSWGEPDSELATKPHYPIMIRWEAGLILKDSLILAQRSIEKWAKDMDVEHQKAVGFWDYDKQRSQQEDFTPEELEYIEHDTLAGVECLDALRIALDKNIVTMPYTATGIPRNEVRKRGKPARARDFFTRTVMSFEDYVLCEQVYHGGYTHANRHEVGYVHQATCFDFASSYPYVLLSEKYPMERFTQLSNKSAKWILQYAAEYAFMFRFIVRNIRLKDRMEPMPVLQFSQCEKTVNAVVDNGRILAADLVIISLNEIDLELIVSQYRFTAHICTDVRMAVKKYLPRYLTDYIFQCFEEKTKLKGGDPVSYALAKSRLNSVYG